MVFKTEVKSEGHVKIKVLLRHGPFISTQRDHQNTEEKEAHSSPSKGKEKASVCRNELFNLRQL